MVSLTVAHVRWKNSALVSPKVFLSTEPTNCSWRHCTFRLSEMGRPRENKVSDILDTSLAKRDSIYFLWNMTFLCTLLDLLKSNLSKLLSPGKWWRIPRLERSLAANRASPLCLHQALTWKTSAWSMQSQAQQNVASVRKKSKRFVVGFGHHRFKIAVLVIGISRGFSMIFEEKL